MKKILIVEDEESIQLLLKYVFMHDQNEVVTCSNRDEAEQALSLHRFDLVMTDVRLHWKDRFGGIRLLEHIKEKHPSAEVIVMTGSGTDAIRDEAYRKGALFFYEKPFNIRHLTTLVQGQLGIPVSLSSGPEYNP